MIKIRTLLLTSALTAGFCLAAVPAEAAPGGRKVAASGQPAAGTTGARTADTGRISFIPRPSDVSYSGGRPFTLTAKTSIGFDAAVRAQAAYLRDVVSASTGYLPALREGRSGTISLRIDTVAVPKAEGYHLTIAEKGVTVVGHDPAGVFYGLQTLLQAFPPQLVGSRLVRDVAWTAPALTVVDAPNRPWRGMMLDVGRYFFDKEFVKKYIDMMATYKLNKLQFHLIEDSGWRLEIKKYPRLTEVGAWAGPDASRLGGYYTQDDIRELVAYAAVRGVDIIPEIEFPAHVLSAIVAYPWLSCTGEQHEVPTQHFISRDLLCIGKPRVLQFLRDVLDETVALFPSKYINIGGDEAVYTRWDACPDCQALMRREGLHKSSELQGWLTNEVARWMKEKGRTVVGWEEIIMRGKVTTPVVGLIWHNTADTIVATRTGHKALLGPATNLYFDFPESATPGEPQHATWMPPVSLEKAYSIPVNDYSPTSTTIGVQACLWSDQFIHGTRLQEIPVIDENRSERYAEYFTFPRLLALAEVGWCPTAGRDFADFRHRLAAQFPRLDAKDCGYRVPEPDVKCEKTAAGYTFTVTPNVDGAEVRYATNGAYPNVHSPLYAGPVTVKNKSDFLAINVVTPRHYSLPFRTPEDYSAYARYGTYTTSWQPLRVQTRPTTWRFECTGKVNANGRYEVTFIQERGANSLRLGTLAVYKRDELMAKVEQNATTTAPVTCTFTIDKFEAGTPFYIDVVANGQGGNDTAGMVFIRKVN